jgi:hypothetical protein
MDVTPQTAAATLEYEGMTVCFFSPGCKGNSEKYAAKYLDRGHRTHM